MKFKLRPNKRDTNINTKINSNRNSNNNNNNINSNNKLTNNYYSNTKSEFQFQLKRHINNVFFKKITECITLLLGIMYVLLLIPYMTENYLNNILMVINVSLFITLGLILYYFYKSTIYSKILKSTTSDCIFKLRNHSLISRIIMLIAILVLFVLFRYSINILENIQSINYNIIFNINVRLNINVLPLFILVTIYTILLEFIAKRYNNY